MPRESVEVKGRRLLTEGRLSVREVDWSTRFSVVAHVRSDSGATYGLGYDRSAHEWRCTCEARGRCSHLVALQLVAPVPASPGPIIAR